MPCLIAIRMSSNLPFIFDHFKYLGSYYVDGGIYNNFPINIGEEYGNKILGITLAGMNTNKNFTENNNTIEYIYKIISIVTRQNVHHNIEKASDKCVIVKLFRNNSIFFNFNIDTHTKLEMFSNGYHQMKEQWE